jgi:2-polyprenyl-6-methoxyphenol hydroxylase-like FAD-dependent oxidoreductase
VAPWLLAADGARSTARHQMNAQFPGSTLADEWYLADVALDTALTDETGHVFFHPDGAFLFMIRVVNDVRQEDPKRPVWRLVGNRPDVLSLLVEAEPIGEPSWTSSFRVSHRIVSSFSAGHVYFAGDAAHIHSPMGARGMNLGLEDAFVFASLAGAARLGEYHQLRHPVDERVVREVELFSRLVSSDALWARFARRCVLPTMVKTPIRERIRRTVTGLDHDLPSGLQYTDRGQAA